MKKTKISGTHFILFIALITLIKSGGSIFFNDHVYTNWILLIIYSISWIIAMINAVGNDEQYQVFYGKVSRVTVAFCLIITLVLIFADFGYLFINLPIFKK